MINVMIMFGRRGFYGLSAILLLVFVTLTTLSLWSLSEFLNIDASLTSEYLVMSNATLWASGGERAIKFLVTNTGTNDARLEFIEFNGDITPYASKISGEWMPYNFVEDEYLLLPYTSPVGEWIPYNFMVDEYFIIPHDTQVEIYIPYETREESLDIRLHTMAGNNYTQALLASSLQ
jgi:hypothetical protein